MNTSTTRIEEYEDVDSTETRVTLGAGNRTSIVLSMARRGYEVPEMEVPGQYPSTVVSPFSTLNTDPIAQSVDKNAVDLPEYSVNSQSQRYSFIAEQEWEGTVLNIDEETFVARLHDLSVSETTNLEEADFPISDISDSDHDLLVPGAVFRWCIGYLKEHGTKSRMSKIVFRHLPAWRETDLVDAEHRANQIANSIDWK